MKCVLRHLYLITSNEIDIGSAGRSTPQPPKW